MNNSLKLLYDEHEIIVNAIDVSNQAKGLIGKNDILYESMIRQLIIFFRNYADKFHHYKEEIILFPEMCRQNEMLQDGIIKEMLDNHEDFREMIRDIEKNLDAKKHLDAHATLEKYGNALLDHIAVENEEVFQMAETLFEPNELEKIHHRFLDCDSDLGDHQKKVLAETINDLRKQLFLMD